MTPYSELAREIHISEAGPHIGVICHLDSAISGLSTVSLAETEFSRGPISADFPMRVIKNVFQSPNRVGMLESLSNHLIGLSREECEKLGEVLYEKYFARFVFPEARDLILAHLEKDHTVILLTENFDVLVHSVAKLLKIENVVSSCLSIDKEDLVGGVDCNLFDPEVRAIKTFETIDKLDINLSRSYVYTGSESDLPLLKCVGRPRLINPTKALSRAGQKMSWHSIQFKSRGKSTFSDYARALTSQMIIPASVIAGLPILALTGSKIKARNYSHTLISNLSSIATGMELVVEGERYLWEQRPAVYIFNHQSQLDPIIVEQLVQKDMIGIGKLEVSKIPFFGAVIEYMGAVFVDRRNSASAIEALKPVVDVIKKQGQSVLIAPEGTRLS